MTSQPRGARPKHVPQRTCIACRQIAGKRAFIRLVRTDQGVEIDSTGKAPGRGAYLHPERRCWEIVLKGNRIEQALRVKLTAADRSRLLEFTQTLPEAGGEDDAAPDGQHQAQQA